MGFDTLEINLVESNVRSEGLCIDQIVTINAIYSNYPSKFSSMGFVDILN